MKRILITGANSYIGSSFKIWLNQFKDEYEIDTLDMKNKYWMEKDFSGYDSIIHLAAIVHTKKADKELYKKININLAFEVAKKAKLEKVKQFIFFSTMSVYGLNTGRINEFTECKPTTPYGKSKYEAERKISTLIDNEFSVVIVRPPIVYGANSKGNYKRLAQIAKKVIFFPNIKNERSMIHIDNLNNFLKLVIDENISGVLFPQNNDYVCTSEMVYLISKVNKKRIFLFRGFNSFIKILLPFSSVLQKLFGNLTYDKNISKLINKDGEVLDYVVQSFENSIMSSEVKYE